MLTFENQKLQQEKNNFQEELSQVKENLEKELKQEGEKVSSLEEQVAQLSLENKNITTQLQEEGEKLSSLEEQGSKQIPPSEQTQGDLTAIETPLAGKKLVIIGRLKKFTRNQIKELVQKAGGSLSTSVSSQTDYLLVGKSPGLKQLKKAEKLGLNQLSETQFLELLELAQIIPH